MSEREARESQRERAKGAGGRHDDDREARLAAQLRENLKKRKALARARQQSARTDR